MTGHVVHDHVHVGTHPSSRGPPSLQLAPLPSLAPRANAHARGRIDIIIYRAIAIGSNSTVTMTGANDS